MTAQLAAARRTIERFQPAGPDVATAREQILSFLDAHADALHRSCVEGHLTGSALVVSDDRRRVLLMHHRKLGLWLQMGGHADGDGDLERVARREAVEESGIETLRLVGPVDLDVHRVDPPGEQAHLHLDVRYAALAPPGARAIANQESLELRWFEPDRLPDADRSTRRLVAVSMAALH
jgi:8-oxo-dGTP pyrophosphatase MutT (NUDIX family)